MKSFAVFALAAVLAPVAIAQHQTFAVNSEASEVKMTLNTTHEVVVGTFHIQSGSIEFDRGAPKMSGSVIVLAGSGKTGNNSRDKKMNNDILKVEQYATVSFEPKTYAGAFESSRCWARLTKSPCQCLYISMAPTQQRRLTLLCLTSIGD